MKNSSVQEQELIDDQAFEAFLSGGFETEIRLNFVSRFLEVLKISQVEAVLNFMIQKMSVIWNLTEASLKTVTENALVDRCGGYMIIEAFVSSVPRERIEKESFNYAGRLNNGSNMIKEIIRKAKTVRREFLFFGNEPVKQELFRKFHCFCYRALAVTVCNTTDSPEIYNLTLFNENPQCRHYIWRELVDMRNEQQRLETESTSINDYGIMSVLVGIVNHIFQNKISPCLSIEKYEEKEYEWVLSLAASIKNSLNHTNVRIFLAKLVENCRSVFVHYAKQLLGAVLSVITDGCRGNKMNFLITDLVSMLLSWSHIYTPTELSEKQDACTLLNFFKEEANNARDENFELNLLLIKRLVEVWSEAVGDLQKEFSSCATKPKFYCRIFSPEENDEENDGEPKAKRSKKYAGA